MKRSKTLAFALVTALALAACGGDDDPEAVDADGEAEPAQPEETSVQVGEGETTIEYALWEAAQLPAYEECATAFTAEHPEISISIQQLGWDDYWNAIVTGLVSGEAPDVFTNHLSRYPEFAANDQLIPIDEFVARDGIDVDQYFEGLADLWVDPEGDRYGLPKDWDTISIFYNEDYLADAGLTSDDLSNMEWNPTDGGSFEDVVARLTVDANGVRGDEDGFDPDNVEVFGIGMQASGGNGHGQQHWSTYAASNGFQYTNSETWGDEYNYDSPEFVETIDWYRGLVEKGYMNTLEEALSGVGGVESFGAGRFAMLTDGSWTTRAYFGLEEVNVGLAPVPVGPTGQRASMFNGLADSIYAGTEHPEEAWEWVKFLASRDCQDIVGEHAVVFPAIPASAEIANQQYAEAGIDASAFTVHVEEGTTFLFPITEHASEIYAILEPTMDSIFSFEADTGEAMTQANDQINALFD
jgi:multiple sugar transport system substrate-binding protein